jgi:hypothetical protein
VGHNQVDLDSHPDRLAGAAEDNTHLALAEGLKRQLSRLSAVIVPVQLGRRAELTLRGVILVLGLLAVITLVGHFAGKCGTSLADSDGKGRANDATKIPTTSRGLKGTAIRHTLTYASSRPHPRGSHRIGKGLHCRIISCLPPVFTSADSRPLRKHSNSINLARSADVTKMILVTGVE